MSKYTKSHKSNYHYTTPIQVYQQVIKENWWHPMVPRWKKRIEYLENKAYALRQASYRRMAEERLEG